MAVIQSGFNRKSGLSGEEVAAANVNSCTLISAFHGPNKDIWRKAQLQSQKSQ